jgi:hypothetical protein
MDQETLVADQIKDGEKLAHELVEAGLPVVAVFWLKTHEDSKWYFYVVSPDAGSGVRDAYRKIHAVMRAMPQPLWVGFFDVKAIAPSDPLAEAVLALQRKHGGETPMRYGFSRLGDRTIEGGYFYPPPVTSANR